MTQDKRVAIRLNQNDYEKLEKSGQVYGLSAGQFLKKTALDVRLRKPLFSDEIGRAILLELTRQGSNINQITRKINSGELPNNVELNRILKGYGEIWRLLQR
jgi:hypothetical protein